MGKAKTAQAAGKELAKTAGVLDKLRDQDLKGIDEYGFDDLIAQLQQEGALVDAAAIGDGFHLLQGKEDKKKLEGIPLVILDWQKNPGRFGGFMTLKLVTKTPVFFDGQGYSKFIVNDGGTGIKRQMEELIANGISGAIVCRKGLRVSEDYEVMEEYINEGGEKQQRPVLDPATNKPVLGTTFYIDTSL